MPLTFGSLFAGIGGFDLGLERAGMVCKWQVEIDPFCQKVLEKHWPDVARYGDVRECGSHNLEAVDLIAGGFPCQDISKAKRGGGGIKGKKSGLWSEFARILEELYPRYALIENVTNLFTKGFEVVLQDLYEVGYDGEWTIIPACALSASHTRERVFIVAYSNGQRCKRYNPNKGWMDEENCLSSGYWAQRDSAGRSERTGCITRDGSQPQDKCNESGQDFGFSAWPEAESSMARIAYGIPNQLDRLRALGNAVVPQVAEWLGRLIVAVEKPA